jgi:hypothetical protein
VFILKVLRAAVEIWQSIGPGRKRIRAISKAQEAKAPAGCWRYESRIAILPTDYYTLIVIFVKENLRNLGNGAIS